MSLAASTLRVLRKEWARLAQISIWITSIVINFQAVPPRRTPSTDSDIWVSAAQFLLVVILGLVIGFIDRWRKSKAVWLWGGALCLVIAITCFFLNLWATHRWTCPYDGRGPVIIGATLSHAGAAYKRANPDASCTTMLQDSAGANLTVWIAEEIDVRHIALTSLFLITVLAFSLSAILMLESLRVQGRTRRRS